MSWIITEDLISEGLDVGRANIAPEHTKEQVRSSVKALPFLMFDDDGELYYRGKYLEDEGSDELQPLDDFGTPNAGCTNIHMYNPKTRKMEAV